MLVTNLRFLLTYLVIIQSYIIFYIFYQPVIQNPYTKQLKVLISIQTPNI